MFPHMWWFPILYLGGILVCATECGSASICVMKLFSFFFSVHLFVLSYSGLFVFILLYFIFLYYDYSGCYYFYYHYYSYKSLCFKREQERMWIWWVRREDQREVGGVDIVIRIYCIKINLFSIKIGANVHHTRFISSS